MLNLTPFESKCFDLDAVSIVKFEDIFFKKKKL